MGVWIMKQLLRTALGLSCLHVVLALGCGDDGNPAGPTPDPHQDPLPSPGFVYIPPGTFMMGSPEDEPGRPSDSPDLPPGPDMEVQHQVTLTQGLFMSEHEVTEGWWHQVMGGTPRDPELPMRFVSWDMAVEFCNALSAREGLTPAYTIHGPWGDVIWHRDANGYRLPTEAEWEYACRAGTTTPFNNGTYCLSPDTEANFKGNSEYNHCPWGVNRGVRTPAGSFPANQWGLYDMHGNVCEWVWCGRRAFTSSPVVDPVHNVGLGASRVFRGGHWGSYAKFCRAAYRNGGLPGRELYNVGFRPVRSAL